MKNLTRVLLLSLNFLGILILPASSSAQAPNWQWANSAGGSVDVKGFSTAVDANGNVYVTGSFDSSSAVFNGTSIYSWGGKDLFLVKYNSAGIMQWAKSFGGNKDEIANAVTCDKSGNVYVTGSFESDSLWFAFTTLHNAGMKDMFIFKYSSSGTELMAKSSGGTGDDIGYYITTDDSANIYATGNFTSPTISFGTTVLTAVGTGKMFVAKYTSGGTVLWANGSGGPSFDFGKCISVDENGDVYVGMEYYEYSVILGTDTFLNSGENDIAIVKYNSAGNFILSNVFGGFNVDKITGIIVDGNDVYITGHYYSPFIAFGNSTLNNAGFGAWDMYIAKFNKNINAIWAKSASGNASEDVSVGIGKDNNGNLYIGGWYKDSVSFGSTRLHSTGTYDVFAVKYDTAGTEQWAVSAGGNGDDFAMNATTDENGNVYLTGFFNSASLPFGTTTLTNVNPGWDMFIAKLGNVPTAVNEISGDNSFTVYPNPAAGIFSVSGLPDGESKIKIFSETGMCVYQSVIFNRGEIDLSGLSKGIYFCRMQNDKNVSATAKIIIE